MAFPATFKSVQDGVIAKLRLDPLLDLGKVKDWINQAYAEVAVETRCFLKTSFATTTVNVGTYTIDSSILHIELITCTPPGGTAWQPLVEVQLDELLNYRGLYQGASGPPRKYALVGLSQFEVWPTPSEMDTLTFWYSVLPAVLAGDSDQIAITEPYGSALLEYGACIKGCEWKRDIMMLGDYQSQYAASLQAFQRYLNRKAGAYPLAFPTWTDKQPWGMHDPSMDVPSYPGGW